jgi:phage gp36-like protein
MAYATLLDLAQQGLPDPALEEIDDPTKTAALEAASKLADDYIGGAFVLPLSSYGASLTRHVVSIAVYDLLTRRGFNPDGSDENVRRRYEDAIRWLERIADGRLKPADIIDSTPDEIESASYVVTRPKRGW